MNKPTFSERFRYWFDNWMSRGTLALMALLSAASAQGTSSASSGATAYQLRPGDAVIVYEASLPL